QDQLGRRPVRLRRLVQVAPRRRLPQLGQLDRLVGRILSLQGHRQQRDTHLLREHRPMRKTLTSGNWIDILPIQALKAKHRDRTAAAAKLYTQFEDDGKPDLSRLPLSMSLQTVRRNALLAQVVTAWSFVLEDLDEEGNPREGTAAALPVPYWDSE